MSKLSDNVSTLPTMKQLKPVLAPYMISSTRRAVIQLANSVLPFLALYALMLYTVRISVPLTMAIGVLAGGFMIRTFILFHDCGHNSLFNSTKTNRLVGSILGVLVLTPGEQWWHSHAIHHATNGNLDKRGVGDVETMTLEEYRSASWFKRASYRVFRFPAVMFLIGPFFMFGIMSRIPRPKYGRRETMSVVWTNLALLAIAVGLSLTVGFWNFLLIESTVLLVAGMIGIWMFYIQHNYQGMYWRRTAEWDYLASAVVGSSFYDLPSMLRWFTGNIGYHHIHHLSPRIPNYNLKACCESSPLMTAYAARLTFGSSLKSMGLRLYDEETRRMVGFDALREPVRGGVKSAGD